ncbi:winged helix-turn-helix domain-containing protein [Streptomyces sp. NPDC001868]|uniref:ArsR/SmtB family transcription factor n=1 Tax=Streptomyces sp. NPDC001868 TaxID=3154401 RepID=UPI003317022D
MRIPRSVHVLRTLVRPYQAFPDFLMPPNVTDLDVGLDALLHTPRSFLHDDLEEFTRHNGRPLPAWARALADGSPTALGTVSRAVREWHDAAIAPLRQHLHTSVEAARSSAARTLLSEGLDAMLSRLHPTIRWTPPVLEIVRPDLDEDFHLQGSGLRLLPSLFSGRAPVISLCSAPLVVAFPVSHDTLWSPEPHAAPAPRRRTLAGLLGRTRATVLHAITTGHGVTTTDLAQRTGISLATVSHHTTVLREAGLITAHPTGPHVHHLPTPLGAELIHGERPHPVRRTAEAADGGRTVSSAPDQPCLSTIEAGGPGRVDPQP